MSGVTQQLLASLGGVAPAEISYTGDITPQAPSQSVYTFTAAPIGTVSSDRYIAVCINTSVGGAIDLTSVTVGGAAMTRKTSTSIRGAIIVLSDAPVTSGTTADIVVTFASAVSNCGISVYAITGLQSTTAVDNQFTSTDAGTMNLTTSADGIVIACAKASVNCTFTTTGGPTENRDTTWDSSAVSMTTASGTSSGSSQAIVIDATTSTAFQAVCASFR